MKKRLCILFYLLSFNYITGSEKEFVWVESVSWEVVGSDCASCSKVSSTWGFELLGSEYSEESDSSSAGSYNLQAEWEKLKQLFGEKSFSDKAGYQWEVYENSKAFIDQAENRLDKVEAFIDQDHGVPECLILSLLTVSYEQHPNLARRLLKIIGLNAPFSLIVECLKSYDNHAAGKIKEELPPFFEWLTAEMLNYSQWLRQESLKFITYGDGNPFDSATLKPGKEGLYYERLLKQFNDFYYSPRRSVEAFIVILKKVISQDASSEDWRDTVHDNLRKFIQHEGEVYLGKIYLGIYYGNNPQKDNEFSMAIKTLDENLFLIHGPIDITGL